VTDVFGGSRLVAQEHPLPGAEGQFG
jgi:hypothetical protein